MMAEPFMMAHSLHGHMPGVGRPMLKQLLVPEHGMAQLATYMSNSKGRSGVEFGAMEL